MSEQVTRCPVCNVPLAVQGTACPGCGEDLSPLVFLEREAAILYNRGLRCAERGEVPQAISLLERSLQADCSAIQAQTLLAKMYLRQGQRAEAAAIWQRALEIEPDNQEIRSGLDYLEQLEMQDAADNRQRRAQAARSVRRRFAVGISLAFFVGVVAFWGIWSLLGGAVRAPTVLLTPTLPAVAIGQMQTASTTSSTGTVAIYASPIASPSVSSTALPTANMVPSSTDLPTPAATDTPTIVATVTPGQTATATSTPTPDLLIPVRQALSTVSPAAEGLEVLQADGLIRIGGTVSSLVERYRIEYVVRSVPGVSAVDLADLKVVTRYRVRAGDTLYGIAKMIYGDGTRWILLADANDIRSPYLIYTGEVLAVPLP